MLKSKSWVYAEVKYADGHSSRIDIEVNLDKESTFKKATAYGSGTFANSLKISENYAIIPDLIQICFDAYEINKSNPNIVKRCFLKDETNQILDDSLEFRHINIVKCKGYELISTFFPKYDNNSLLHHLIKYGSKDIFYDKEWEKIVEYPTIIIECSFIKEEELTEHSSSDSDSP